MDIAAKYPLIPNEFGSMDTVFGIDMIRQSIQDILETPVGSRFGCEDYGSYVHLLIFEQNDSVLESLLYYYITSALELWEKRIKTEDISFVSTDTEIACKIIFTVLNVSQIFEYDYVIKR